MYSFKHNQQDAMSYNILYYCPCSTCFGQFLGPSRTVHTASGMCYSSKQTWHIPDALCTVLELLMMGRETAQNMYSVDNNKEYCITLHLVGCT